MKTATTTNPLHAAFRFFCLHSGYIVGEKAKGALLSARAERDAASLGIYFAWEPDYDAQFHGGPKSWGWTGKDLARWNKTDHIAEGCIAYSADGEVLASLWGIWDADNNYRRVIEAELAMEAIDELRKVGAV